MNAYQPTTLSRNSTREERDLALHQIYTQVLERQPYSAERKILARAEKDFLNGKLGVRHFLKELTTSSVYLDSFYYNCSNLKFIEWCLKHLLGRAPIDQQEIKVYAGILMSHGASALIGEILGSEEYRTVFGCFTIPYARTMKFYPSIQNFRQSDLLNHEHTGQRGKVVPTMYWQQLGLNCDGGSCERPEVQGEAALRQIYNQVLQRQPYASERKVLAQAEQDFLSGKLDVRHFLKALATSSVYLESFYYGCSNLKFLEWCAKHFLGRALIDREEIKTYVDLLMHHGVSAVVDAILDSEEYRKLFGRLGVPHARNTKFYPSMQTFLQSQILNHEHVGQRGKVVPTIYWKQLGLNCDSGVCVHPEVDGAFKLDETFTATHSNTLEDEIEDLIRMLQAEDVKKIAQQMSGRQRSLIRDLAKN